MPPRPIRRDNTRRDPVWRIVPLGYLTPRLRDDHRTEAIGFRWEPPRDDEGDAQ